MKLKKIQISFICHVVKDGLAYQKGSLHIDF